MQRTKVQEPLSKQMRRKVSNSKPEESEKEYDGDFGTVISTGSTLLDLEISGGRVKGGGLCGGMFVEIFGPESSGKTVMLCEIAGGVQRQGGDVRFDDPEARLNKQFAKIFDLDTEEITYDRPNTVTEVFKNIRKWKPDSDKVINGTFTDSLAALSTNLEMDNEEGDKMGQRRAKEFSEGFRKNARILTERNYLMVCSNQIRDTGNSYGPKTDSPGGKAIRFYASLRIKANTPEKIWSEKTFNGQVIKSCIGVTTTFEIVKSSVWRPFGSAPVTIIFDYGVDDIRQNLQFVKKFAKKVVAEPDPKKKGKINVKAGGKKETNSVYYVNDTKLDVSLDKSIGMVERMKLTQELKDQVIELWEEMQTKFAQTRQPKER
jgi:recombination protein RecA